MEKGCEEGSRVTVAWGSNTSKCKGTNRNMQYLDSNQEEPGTKLLLHAVDATVSRATRIDIVSPDTDVFVLAPRRHADLCEETRVVTGRGQLHRKIPLCSIVRALCPARIAALPGFHVWSGADVTCSFAGMLFFISSSAVAPRDVERTDVSAGRQGSTALIFAHAVVMMSLV